MIVYPILIKLIENARFAKIRSQGYKNNVMLNSAEHEICFVYQSWNTDKISKLLSASSAELSMKKVLFLFLIFMTKWNFMLSWVEHEKSLITSGPGLSDTTLITIALPFK